MTTLMLLLLFPLAWPFIAQRIWHTTITYQEMAIQIIFMTVVITGTWQAGKWGATQDTEIWNGYVTKKEKIDGHYTTSYCCGTDKDGNCTSTCYTDHYTRKYNGHSTVGDWTFDSIDTTWKSKRDSFPPPASYTNCKIGEPASREHSYTNYVQAVPESLFHDDSTWKQFESKIPSYPKVHGFYKYNRVVQVGANYPHKKELNAHLNETLKTLGRQKQVNIIVILTEIDDPNYRYAVERAWLGGEKNDVVLFIGLDGTKITWVDVMTWALNSGNELFHVKLRDEVKALESIDDYTVLASTLTNRIVSTYDRPRMEDYEYLAEEVEPATWVLILAIFISIAGSTGLTYFFHVKDVDFFRGTRYGRRRRFNKFKF